ncbi:hypothetical protein VULLAG_LOCUS9848 [Vulpes lagopus]
MGFEGQKSQDINLLTTPGPTEGTLTYKGKRRRGSRSGKPEARCPIPLANLRLPPRGQPSREETRRRPTTPGSGFSPRLWDELMALRAHGCPGPEPDLALQTTILPTPAARQPVVSGVLS